MDSTETTESSSGRIVGGGRTAASFVSTALRWIVLLNVVALWLVFWGNLVRLHVSMGHGVDALLTAVLFVAPVVVGGGRWVAGEFGLGGANAGETATVAS